MTDPSSQNPFNPLRGPDQGTPSGGGEKPKLKLKQLLTPLSPHLNVEPKKEQPEEETLIPKRKLEIPKAVPMEPEPELQPHENPPIEASIPPTTPEEPPQSKLTPPELPPSFDNIPHAVPIDPEPELQPHERPPAEGGVPLSPDPTMAPPPMGMPPVDEPLIQQPVMPPPQETIPAPVVEKPKHDKVESLVSARPEEPSRLKKLGLPVIAILVILVAVHFFFDPLGLSIEPIAPASPVVLNEPATPKPAEQAEASSSMASVNLSLELEKMTIESFIEKLDEVEIIPSQNPKGAIIDSVMYSEGSSVNPMLGLVLSSVEDSGRNPSVFITDAEGREYEFETN